MRTKSIIFAILAIILVTTGCKGQNKVSILGDSYSTFGGYVSPAGNLCWYNGADRGHGMNDVNDVTQTWWYRLIEDNGLQLERNNSYSGSTICCTGYRKEDYSDRAFISRVNNLGDPDIIIVFGGTNDSWAKSPIGDFQYSGWDKDDLFKFRPAFAYLLDRLTTLYPKAKILNVTNSQLSDDVTNSMDEICRHYSVTNIQLTDIDKQSGHPSIKGMSAIAEQIAPYCKQ